MIRNICIIDCKTIEDYYKIVRMCEGTSNIQECYTQDDVDTYIRNHELLYDDGVINNFMHFWDDTPPSICTRMTVEEFYKKYDKSSEERSEHFDKTGEYVSDDVIKNTRIHSNIDLLHTIHNKPTENQTIDGNSTYVEELEFLLNHNHEEPLSKILRNFFRDKEIVLKPIVEPKYQWLYKHKDSTKYNLTELYSEQEFINDFLVGKSDEFEYKKLEE